MARVACLAHVRYLVLTDPRVIEHFLDLQRVGQTVAAALPGPEQRRAYKAYRRRLVDTAIGLAGFVPLYEVDELASQAEELLNSVLAESFFGLGRHWTAWHGKAKTVGWTFGEPSGRARARTLERIEIVARSIALRFHPDLEQTADEVVADKWGPGRTPQQVSQARHLLQCDARIKVYADDGRLVRSVAPWRPGTLATVASEDSPLPREQPRTPGAPPGTGQSRPRSPRPP